jgi:tetratricopeptide (TPR) repeat protein
VGTLQKQTLEEIEQEIDNIHAVLRSLSSRGDDLAQDDLALYTCFQYARIRGRLDELVEITDSGLQLLEAKSGTQEAPREHLYWQLLAYQACALVQVARYDRAETLFHRFFAADASHVTKGTFLYALALQHYGVLKLHQGNFVDAGEHHARALNYFEEVGNLNMQAVALNSLGVVYNDLGDYAAAMRYLERSAALNRQIGNRAGLVYALTNWGASAYNQANYAEADAYHAEALKVAREVDFPPGIMLCLLNLADTAIGLGDYARAHALAEEGLAHTKRSHDPRQGVWARSDLGLAALGVENLGAAHEHFCRGMAAGLAIQVVPRTLEALVGLAYWYVQHGDTDGAAELLGFCMNHPNLQQKIRGRANYLVNCAKVPNYAPVWQRGWERGRAKNLEEIVHAQLARYNASAYRQGPPLTVEIDAVW